MGSYFTPDYFDFILDPAVREPLAQISQEINEDLDYFELVLVQHGAEVVRPVLINKAEFIEHWNLHGQFPTPPLQPRNYHTVIGNNIYQIGTTEEAKYISTVFPTGTVIDLSEKNQQFFKNECLLNIRCHNAKTTTWFKKEKYHELAGPDWPDFYDYVQGSRSDNVAIQQELEQFANDLCYESKEFSWIQAPNIFPVNDKLYVDTPEYFDYVAWAKNNIEFGGEIVAINTGAGHTDGCFVVLGQQVIIGTVPGIDFETAFPGYRVVAASDSYLDAVKKRKTIGGYLHKTWWVPGQEHNQPLINHVDQYMEDWTGTAYETSFDLNVLALDEKTVCMIVCDPGVVEQLNSFGITVIEIPWRHKFFVDCGLHCITLDLYRE